MIILSSRHQVILRSNDVMAWQPGWVRIFSAMSIALLSIGLLSSCLMLVESRPIQQVPSPVHDTECEFDALEHYSEQCGSMTVTLPTCNTGYRRIWRCEAGTNGFPEGFDPYHDACGNCPPNTYQSRYNKCRTCHPCSQCEQGQIVEKACEMDHDTVCRSVAPTMQTRAPPLNEATPMPSEKATVNLDSSSALIPSEKHTVWPINWTDPTNESSVELPVAISQMDLKMELWLYRAFIMALFLFLLLALIGWGIECLRRKKLQAMPPENDIQHVAMNNNGAAPHSGDREPDEETAALLGEEHPNEGEGSGRNQATSNSGSNAATGNHLPASSPGNARNLGSNGSRGSTSDNTSSTADEGSIDGAHGTGAGVPVDGAIDSAADGASDSGTGGPSCTDTDGAISTTSDSPTDSSSLPKYINCGAMCGSAADGANGGTTIGAVLSDGGTDDLVPDGERLLDVPVLPNDIASDTLLPNNTQYDSPSETGGDCTERGINGANSGAAVFSDGIPLPVDEIPQDIAVLSINGASSDGGNYGCTDGTISGKLIPGGEQTCTESSHNDTSGASGGGVDVPVDKSPHGVQVGASGGAFGPSSDGAGDDVRRANPATEKLNPGINADDVVTTQFLQHVAQEISHGNSKTICRMLGLPERDIDDVEMLTHKTEQGFEFLKRLLGDIGKDLTYRSIVKALIKCKNKNHADNLIEEFKIIL